MRSRALLTPIVALALLSGCASVGSSGFGSSGFYLVEPGPHSVDRGTMIVTPTIRWNRTSRSFNTQSRWEEWTLNGPLLDSLSFIGALESGKPIIRQRKKADRQVPQFRPDMSPPELASMLESFYRIRGGATAFSITNLSPRPFIGSQGFQIDYDYRGGDEVDRRGRAVGAVIGDRLYLIAFDAAMKHYFPAAIPEFERIAQSAQLRG